MSALQMNLSLSPGAQEFEAVRNKEVHQFLFPFFFTSLESLEFISLHAVI